MWDDEARAIRIRNIILAVLAVLVIAGLAAAYIFVRARNNEIDAQLSEAHTQQQVQQAADKQESAQSVQREYEDDLNVLDQYLPGIVCWGDTITQGTSGDISYPSILQRYINTYLTDVYTFSDSVDQHADYTNVDWDSYTIKIPVQNMGCGDVNSATVLARAGVAECLLSQSVTIPADLTPVRVYLSDADDNTLDPLDGGDLGINPVTLGGIEGTLSIDSSDHYFFTRSAAGEETTLEKGTAMTLSSVDLYKNYIHVICIGNYDTSTSPDQLVANVKEMIARQTQNSDRYIVLGIWYTGGDIYSGGGWIYSDRYDKVMQQEFGNRYINIRSYLYTDGLTEAGITATSNDKTAIQQETVPYSFRSTVGDGELTGTAYKLIGKLIYNRMDSLGFFDEVKENLAIDVTTRKLVANNPDYFKNIISADPVLSSQ